MAVDTNSFFKQAMGEMAFQTTIQAAQIADLSEQLRSKSDENEKLKAEIAAHKPAPKTEAKK